MIFDALQNYTSKHVSIVSFLLRFYICKPGQSRGLQCVSVYWQHECEPPGKRKAVWNTASRTETVETVATTTANHKNTY